jgi:hypothetical protein
MLTGRWEGSMLETPVLPQTRSRKIRLILRLPRSTAMTRIGFTFGR